MLNPARWGALVAVLGLVLAASSHAMTPQERSPTDGPLALTGGTIYRSPTEQPIKDGVVVIRDGVIAAVGPRGSVPVPSGVPTLDCSGLTVTAGFWNSHVHFFQRKWADAASIPAAELALQLQAMLTRYGFTSAFDLGSPWANTRTIRDRVESGEVAGPRIRSTGEALLGKGWMPPAAILGVLGVMSFPTPEVADPAEAVTAARNLLDSGTDGLKLFAAGGRPPSAVLPHETIRAAVNEARQRKKPVFAHPGSRDGVLAAVQAGVDVIAHTTPQTGPWDDAVLTAMREAKVSLIPTLKIWKYQLRHDRASLGERSAQTSTGQLAAWLATGGVVLFGSDVGGMDDYDPTEEYVLMAQAGMTFAQILTSLTVAPAAKFGEPGRLGRIAPGLRADLVVLAGDPSLDVRALAAVRYTIRDGRVIYP
jgi:imidazolonepropionase-like amidohydrolase